MLVQPQCAATVCELLIEEEPWLGGMVLVFPLWLSYDPIRSCVPPASQRCCYCFLQCGTELSQHFWCFHFKWPFHFSFSDMKTSFAPLKSVGSTACLPVMHPIISVLVCLHLTPADLLCCVYFSVIPSTQQHSRCCLPLLVPSWYFQFSSHHFSFSLLLTKTVYPLLARSRFAVWGLACTHTYIRSKSCDL